MGARQRPLPVFPSIPKRVDAKHLNSGFFHDGKLYCAHSNYPKLPESSQLMVLDPDTMKPRVNNPAWVQAIQDVMDLIATPGASMREAHRFDPRGQRRREL